MQVAENEQMARTTKERQEVFRERLANAGLSEVRGIYLPKHLHPKLKAAAEKLRKKPE